jgi:hypothetical protein
MGAASSAFGAWLAASIAPIARAHGFTGNGPTFRKRDGSNWVLFAVERKRLDPAEAQAFADDPQIGFRLNVGVVVSAVRPRWQPGRDRPPGMHDITMFSLDQSLAPANGAYWHVFDADDRASQAALTDLVSNGLGRAVAGLATSAGEVLERRLSVEGPLENLSPGGAEELLAMADAAGDAELHERIISALQREPVQDPLDHIRQGSLPRYGYIHPPWRPRRRTRRQLQRLLADLASDRVYARRKAASGLGGWDDDPAVVDALRDALRHADPWTRGFAALSLGQVADAHEETWRVVLGMAVGPESAPHEIGAAIVLLAALDPPARGEEASSALEAMAAMSPAWTRDLRAFRERVAGID